MTPGRAAQIDVALLIPLHGSAGIFGPSCELCAGLAVHELNAAGGIAGREVRLRVVDGAQPAQAARAIRPLADAGRIDAVVGWHLSSVRRAIAPIVAGRLPYVYTALYEGGERTPGVFVVGETPGRQLLPAMRWYRREHGVRRWCVVGNDYVWPRETAAAAREFAGLCDGAVMDELFLPLGTEDFGDALRGIDACRADAVLMLLVGDDAARFNRAFAAAELDDRRRLSTLVDENVLLASGAASTRGLGAAAAYFEALVTPESLDFGARYGARFGPDAPPLNSIGESCYEGLLLLAELARRAGGLDVMEMCAIADSVAYAGPRGDLRLRERHVDQPVYLAEADGLELDVVARL